ncbi:hypothetical protein [Parapusillimonas granuli]|uniref:Riboflavin biosynthesis protein RibA n=1 Tax=Parapusillimonas granuli TaxID=380911 RepID=A0A853G547_9BURK|nr:hypothetical protein [Parapusillimonas granuli]MBB5217127.1 hypothetical protein [Parapusillimonas granuli]MEB2401592.1 hypothetical protein [Alcaligenaceae bacterium]NYT50110.1 hypothetical protein [Parapusillimonas granuli]
MVWNVLFGERSTTKIAAIFDTEQGAATAAAAIHSSAGLQAAQIRLVKPYEKDYAKKIEPETQGIVRTALRAHLVLGAAGAVVGFFGWGLLYLAGIIAVTATPLGSLGVFIFFGAIAGMLLGGLVTARPDHQLVIQRVQTATQEGKWTLLIHPRTPRQCDQVMAALSGVEAEVTRSV